MIDTTKISTFDNGPLGAGAAALERGAWEEAEIELAEAARTLRATRPTFMAEAVARLGYLRYRQGRLDEAVTLFEQTLPFPPAHFGLGWLALDLGEEETALDHAERYLRRVPRKNRTERVRGLGLVICSPREATLMCLIVCCQH